MSASPDFHDNRRVKSGRMSNEFLAVTLGALSEQRPFRVYLYRYCVPGRCDTYSFQLRYDTGASGRLEYFSDEWMPLATALKLAEEDFDRPNIVEMCLDAFSAERVVLRYQHDFVTLLSLIAPKSETLRAVKNICEKTRAERSARILAEKETK